METIGLKALSIKRLQRNYQENQKKIMNFDMETHPETSQKFTASFPMMENFEIDVKGLTSYCPTTESWCSARLNLSPCANCNTIIF